MVSFYRKNPGYENLDILHVISVFWYIYSKLFCFVGKNYTESLKRIISGTVKFTDEIFKALSPMVQRAEEIVKQCIKTIEYSLEIVEMDGNEKYVEKFKSFSSEVCTSFLKQNSWACWLNEQFHMKPNGWWVEGYREEQVGKGGRGRACKLSCI